LINMVYLWLGEGYLYILCRPTIVIYALLIARYYYVGMTPVDGYRRVWGPWRVRRTPAGVPMVIGGWSAR